MNYDALYDGLVKEQHKLLTEVFFKLPEEKQSLLSFLDDTGGVNVPFQILADVRA